MAPEIAEEMNSFCLFCSTKQFLNIIASKSHVRVHVMSLLGRLCSYERERVSSNERFVILCLANSQSVYIYTVIRTL